MDRENRRRGGGDSGGDGLRRHEQRVRVDVDEPWPGAGEDDGRGGGDERVRGDDDLVPPSDAESPQDQVEGVGPVGDTDRLRGTAVAGPGLLELVDDRPTDPGVAVEQAGPPLPHRIPDLRRRRREIDEVNAVAHQRITPVSHAWGCILTCDCVLWGEWERGLVRERTGT